MKLFDILYCKNDNPSEKLITYDILDPSEGYVPIAIRVIEKNFLGEGEPSRWMSLKYMCFENAKNGLLCYDSMTWDEPIKYKPKKIDNKYKYTQENLSNSHYKSDWVHIDYEYDSLTNVITDYSLTSAQGKEITVKVVEKFENAKPIGENIKYLDKPEYKTRLQQLKPFYCCHNYVTPGTKQGDWYLPTKVELSFVVKNVFEINERLEQLRNKYIEHCIFGLDYVNYWSSIENDSDSAQYVSMGFGHCSNKSNELSVLAFLQI